MTITNDECCGLAEEARSLDTYRYAVLRLLYKWATGTNPTNDICCGLLQDSRSVDSYRFEVLKLLYQVVIG